MGVPTGIPSLSVSALPFRAYALIMNEWFRDENLSDPLVVPVDDATVVGVNSGTFVTDVAKGGLPYKAAKYHDYFTSCLPSPQKGPDVVIPVAEAGSRYIEILKSHFGVTSPDARLQRPEYLGGNRVPINTNQVIQQSATTEGETAQGTVTGMSVTTDTHSDFTKSFTEHGFVIGVKVARYDHTYQQGLERFWSRKDRFDYYWPVFANIGEQAVKNKEIYAQGTDEDDEVFGYQEAWADYRYKPSRVTGEMRSQYAQSLDVWHLADDYSALPTLSDSWIREDKANVDRVLAVTSSVSNQLFADIYIKNRTTRPMPMYSVPGQIDHH